MAASRRLFMKRLRLLCSQSSLRCFSSSSESGQNDPNTLEKRPKGLFGKLYRKDMELDPDTTPNPVRNTEREYYQTHLNPDWEGHEKSVFESRFYTKKHGISSDLLSWLHWDININDNLHIEHLLKKKLYSNLKKDQRFLKERIMAVGRELGAAHFVVARDGSVKFEDRDVWFKKDENGQYGLPRVMIDNLFLEAIDASNTNLTYVAFDNFVGLSKLRFMRFHNCPYIDDWCLARLQRLRDTLEYLDISDCIEITDNGLTSLHCLHKLKVLRLSNLPKVKHLGLIVLMLEEKLPSLTVLGLSESDLTPPPWDHRGEMRLVRALLGLSLDKDPFQEDDVHLKEIGTTTREELKRYVRKIDS